MTHDEYEKLVTTGGGPSTLEQEEEVLRHLETCPDCIRANAKSVQEPATGRTAWWLFAFAVFFLALWIWREAGIRVAREALRGERAEVVGLRNAESVLRDQKEKLSDELAVISAPGVIRIQLTGGQSDPNAIGKLYIDPQTHRAVLAATDLPKTGPKLDYQVWVYGPDGSPHSAGIFDMTNGHMTVRVANVTADVKSVVVTLEKNGGVPQPGPNVVLSGKPSSAPTAP